MSTPQIKDFCNVPVSQDTLENKHGFIKTTVTQSKSRANIIPFNLRKDGRLKQTTWLLNTPVVSEHLESKQPIVIDGIHFTIHKYGKDKLILISDTCTGKAGELLRKRLLLDCSIGADKSRHLHLRHTTADGVQMDVILTTLNAKAARILFG